MYFQNKDNLPHDKLRGGFVATATFSAADIFNNTHRFLEYKLAYKTKGIVSWYGKRYRVCAIDIAYESVLFGLKEV